MPGSNQLSLFDPPPTAKIDLTPAGAWELDSTKRALDDLFSLTFQYRTSKSYHELMKFVARFRSYSPFNAMLVHIQMPGATFVAPPHRWRDDWDRTIKPGARPLVILQPMGPVMFVFDVSDTVPQKNAKELPKEVENPFKVEKGFIGGEFNRLIENAIRDGIRITQVQDGSQSAGSISTVDPGNQSTQRIQNGVDKIRQPIFVDVPVKYDLFINAKHNVATKYTTLAHELAHLYCGHLGTPNPKWWPDRRGLDTTVAEFEAESVTYMVCRRLDVFPPSHEYLADYLNEPQVPAISLDRVMKAAGLIETMSKEKLKVREKDKGS